MINGRDTKQSNFQKKYKISKFHQKLLIGLLGSILKIFLLNESCECSSYRVPKTHPLAKMNCIKLSPSTLGYQYYRMNPLIFGVSFVRHISDGTKQFFVAQTLKPSLIQNFILVCDVTVKVFLECLGPPTIFFTMNQLFRFGIFVVQLIKNIVDTCKFNELHDKMHS